MIISRPDKRVGSGHGSKRVQVKMGSGQNGSIKKKVVLVRWKRVRVDSGFGSGRVSGRVGLV
ncbi:hypothetical protein HanIR_Chr17g0901531 [Helianthus annuus]|nr:hypothetical protein HanIR_Chr17g0901531 [Helianthus annuus]